MVIVFNKKKKPVPLFGGLIFLAIILIQICKHSQTHYK